MKLEIALEDEDVRTRGKSKRRRRNQENAPKMARLPDPEVIKGDVINC